MRNIIEGIINKFGNKEEEKRDFQKKIFKIIFEEDPEKFFKEDPNITDSNYQTLKKVIRFLSKKETFDEIISYTMKYFEQNEFSSQTLFNIISVQLKKQESIKDFIIENPFEAVLLIFREAHLLMNEEKAETAAKELNIESPTFPSLKPSFLDDEKKLKEAYTSHLFNALSKNTTTKEEQNVIKKLREKYKKEIESSPRGLFSIRSFDK